MRQRLDGFAIATLIMLTAMWGVQQVTVKLAITGGLPTTTQAALRSLGAAICIALWIGLRQGRAGLTDLLARPTLLPGAIIAVLFAGEFLALYQGVRLTTASRAVMFLYSAPFFTALGAHLWLPGERMRWRQAAGLVIAFTGVGIAFSAGLAAGGGGALGDMLCLLAGALWGATIIVIKATPVLIRAPAAKVLWLQLAGSAPLLLGAAALTGDFAPLPAPSATAWLCLAYQTFGVATVSFLAWFNLLSRYPANLLSSFTLLGPIFGTLSGVVMLGDPLGWPLLAGLAAISIGLRLVNTKGPAT